MSRAAATILAVPIFLSCLAYGAKVKQVAEFTAPPSAQGDEFGLSVAVQGSTVVVGAPSPIFGGTGIAYVFVESQGVWQQAAQLGDGAAADELGWSVAIGGNVIAVGALAGNGGDGAIYVFVKPLGGWKNTTAPAAELTVPNTGIRPRLGTSIAITSDGKTVVAGAPGVNPTGAAYVFVEPPEGWANMTQPTATLTTPSADVDLGQSVAIGNDTVVAGEKYTGQPGQACVFVQPPGGWTGTLQPTALLTASDEGGADGFGSAVAISGSTIAVGAPFHGNPGAAYVYVEPLSGWANMTQTAELGVPTGQILELGTSMAVGGNAVLAGAPLDIIGMNTDQGAVYGYLKPTTGWTNSMSPKISVTASPGAAQERFGWSIAVSGKTFVVGAPYDGGSLQGAVYIFAVQ